LEELYLVNQAITSLLHASRVRKLKSDTQASGESEEETKIEVSEGVFKDKISASGL